MNKIIEMFRLCIEYTRLSIAVLRKRDEKGNLLYLGKGGIRLEKYNGWIGEGMIGDIGVMGKCKTKSNL